MKNYDEEILKHYGGFQTQILNILKSFSEENKVKSENNNKLTNDEKIIQFHTKEKYITNQFMLKNFTQDTKLGFKINFLAVV